MFNPIHSSNPSPPLRGGRVTHPLRPDDAEGGVSSHQLRLICRAIMFEHRRRGIWYHPSLPPKKDAGLTLRPGNAIRFGPRLWV